MQPVYVLCGESESVNAYPERIPGTKVYDKRRDAVAALRELLHYFGVAFPASGRLPAGFCILRTAPGLLDEE